MGVFKFTATDGVGIHMSEWVNSGPFIEFFLPEPPQVTYQRPPNGVWPEFEPHTVNYAAGEISLLGVDGSNTGTGGVIGLIDFYPMTLGGNFSLEAMALDYNEFGMTALLGGTIRSASGIYSGVEFKVTGLDLDYHSVNWANGIQKFLAEDDTVIGTVFADRLIGLQGNDDLYGGAGNDTLTGGANMDSLTGGAGADRFVYNNTYGAGTWDTINDFNPDDDFIILDKSGIAGLGEAGQLAAGRFRAGTAAQDAGDRIIYDDATGRIWYDADGNGSKAAVLLCKVDPNLGLTVADFRVWE